MLLPLLREQFEQNHRRTADNNESVYRQLFPKAMAMERAFVNAGGLLVGGHRSDRWRGRGARLRQPARD